MAFDFDAAVQAPHRMQPGLRRLAVGALQLTPTVGDAAGAQAGADSRRTDTGQRHLREKLAVLGAFAPQALLQVPGFDAGPALATLAAQAAAEHPAAFGIDGDRWTAHGLGWALDGDNPPQCLAPGWPEVGPVLAALDPAWRRAALLSLAFAEDFAVIDATTGTLPWLAVALPSVWAPEDKVGRSFAEAHAPVADNRLITGAAPQLVRLVTSGERWERFVWTLTAHPHLHAHPDRVDPARWPPGLDDDALAAVTWWRTERQTFIPVPGAAQAVFTIGVDVQPLARAMATPAMAARVHDALASMSDAVLAYRGLTTTHPALLRWLAQRAAASASASGPSAGPLPSRHAIPSGDRTASPPGEGSH
jgi:hypothetical protein